VDNARWLRIDGIFAAALERPPEQRPLYLEQVCGDDGALRREVEALLAEDRDDGFLALPASGEAMRVLLDSGVETALALLAPGQVLGERFRIHGSLGRGGMGEVWRALDLKLRVDVALKALRPDLLSSPNAVEALRQEVRSARDVVSPNVCRVFDLVEVDGRELLSMEYVDGRTLAEVLAARAPLPLDEAQNLASQILAGLEAIHRAGLVHRDIKPENVMLTPAGRVVVMDFGIAKRAAAGAATVAGTLAYMAPEQLRGEALDARADVFAVGLLLAEMVAPGARDAAGRAAIRDAARRGLPVLDDAGWAPVLQRAVAPAREERYPSAAALGRALEEAARRTTGHEDSRPYPGLASFGAGDAPYFFGRELEIEEMWRKLRQAHLLALIGPSGAGKSSFLRAGLVASAPPGWRVVVATPGDRPFAALARALAPELAADIEAVTQLVDFEQADVAVGLAARWRRRHEQTLLVVDQLEELFTQSPPETQERFAGLLVRLALDADVHVLLSLRDDFLIHCHRLRGLAPIFSELTPIGPPTGDALRRALVQPALKCGYRFEDEAMADEMLAEVAGERGALPLVAFAMARLWEGRDRERGLLTRRAYERGGGVAGALAQHAEATLEQIGRDRVPIVRELLRNLVTAQGTRATLDRDELLSVFGPASGGATAHAAPREQAAAVLDALIDARLLTSYELTEGDADRGRQRVEVIHESLLSSWPRLLRWRAQDEQGALLRDQLRQAARLWEERGRPDDLLWSGPSFREYQLWRERYTGGLSASEDRFARAMTVRALRQRRTRQLAVGLGFALLLGVLAVVAGLWRRSEGARLRAEASKLLALGQAELQRSPSAALAYATRSLEVADTREGRLFALRALEQGPTARFLAALPGGLKPSKVAFGPGGWLAVAGVGGCDLWPRSGTPRLALAHPPRSWVSAGFDPAGGRLATSAAGELRIWSVPAGRELWRRRVGETVHGGLLLRGARIFTETLTPEEEIELRRWSFAGGDPALLGTFETEWGSDIDAAGRWLAYTVGRRVLVRSLADWDAPPVEIGVHPTLVRGVSFHPDGGRVAAADAGGEIRIWSAVPTKAGEPLRVLDSGGRDLVTHDPSGRWLAAYGYDAGLGIRVWDLHAPPGAQALRLEQSANDAAPGTFELAFDARSEWMASAHAEHVALWPLTRLPGWSLGDRRARVNDVAFTADSRALLSVDEEGFLRFWPMRGEDQEDSRVLLRNAPGLMRVAVSPSGREVVAAGYDGNLFVVPLDGRPPRRLEGYSDATNLGAVAFSPSGRRLAVAPTTGQPKDLLIRVWELESGSVRALQLPPSWTTDLAGIAEGLGDLVFSDEDRLLSSHPHGLRSWDLRQGTSDSRSREPLGRLALARGARLLLANRVGALRAVPERPTGEVVATPLDGSGSRSLASHGPGVTTLALDAAGTIVVTGSADGLVRVGRVSGEEPWILVGHDGPVLAVAISPDGRWIASGGADRDIRVWPMPDVSRPPLHELGRERLLASLRSLTNLQVVEDPVSPTGWKVQIGPFRGWEEVPTW
jgi:WD40 repeat protein